jgi:polyphosphate kinase
MSSTVRITAVPGAAGDVEEKLNGTPSVAQPIAPDLSDPAFYNNRELSLLEYHQRVLEEAEDPSNPVLERLKFLCIVAGNLDQFFEVRVAGLKQQRQSDLSLSGSDGMSPSE